MNRTEFKKIRKWLDMTNVDLSTISGIQSRHLDFFESGVKKIPKWLGFALVSAVDDLKRAKKIADNVKDIKDIEVLDDK